MTPLPLTRATLTAYERERAAQLGRRLADIHHEEQDGVWLDGRSVWLNCERYADDRERLTEWLADSLWREWTWLGPQARCEALALALGAYQVRAAEIDAAPVGECSCCGEDDCDGGASCPASGG